MPRLRRCFAIQDVLHSRLAKRGETDCSAVGGADEHTHLRGLAKENLAAVIILERIIRVLARGMTEVGTIGTAGQKNQKCQLVVKAVHGYSSAEERRRTFIWCAQQTDWRRKPIVIFICDSPDP